MKIDPRNLFGALPAKLTGGDPVKAAIYPAAAASAVLAPTALGAMGIGGAAGSAPTWGSMLAQSGLMAGGTTGLQMAMPQYGMSQPMQPGQLGPPPSAMPMLMQLMNRKGGF